jgi:arylsulfatase A-like enzyme
VAIATENGGAPASSSPAAGGPGAGSSSGGPSTGDSKDAGATAGPSTDDSKGAGATAARRARFERAVSALGLAGLVAGVADGVIAAQGASKGGWAAVLCGLSWGLWTLGAVVAGAPLCLLAAALPEDGGLEVGGFAALDLAGSALILALGAVIGGPVARVVAANVGPDLRTRAMVGAVIVVVAWLSPLGVLVGRRLAGLQRRFPGARGRVAAVVPWAVIGASALAGVVLYRAELGTVAPAGLAAGAALAFVRWPRLTRVARWVLPAAVLATIPALAAARSAPAAALRSSMAHSGVLAAAIATLERLSDDDGDGYGDRFGGLDCDDHDPQVHPGRAEVPQNGIDDNCRGGDASSGELVRAALPKGLPPRSEVLPHIVLIVMDAVRADHVGAGRGLTPNIDALAQRGTVFSHAFAPASATRMSVPALLSGRWISHTRYEEDRFNYRLDRAIDLLPEGLAARGYFTAAVLPPFFHERMPDLVAAFHRSEDSERGLHTYAEQNHSGPHAVKLVQKALKEAGDAPAFVYVHFADCHTPYTTDGVKLARSSTDAGRYAGEVNRLDGDLAPLLATLDELGKTRPVLIALTADHGEAFGEHGTRYHSRDLFQNVLAVPLVLVGPGVPAGQHIETPVDLLDLGVTLAEAGGAQLRHARTQSLWGLLQGARFETPRPLFSEIRSFDAPYAVYVSMIEWPLKVIYRDDTRERWLYDLDADPGETRDLWAARPAEAARLDATLLQWIESSGSVPAGHKVRTAGDTEAE